MQSVLTFGVYKDAGYTQNFGNSVNDTITVNNPLIGNNTLTVYARIPSGQSPPTGNYVTPDQCNNHLKFGTSNLSLFSVAYANVSGSCSVSVTTNLAFGSYDPIVANAASPKNATAVISVNCANYLPYTVTLGQGSNPAFGSSNTTPLRQMASGANRLEYFLYQDSGYATVWGNTAATCLASSGTSSAQAISVYGQVPAGQNKPAGSYSDTVLATVTF